MSKIGRPKTSKRSGVKTKSLTIGLAGFAKLSAVEGLYLTRDMKGTFRNLKRQGASAKKRRDVIVKKYGSSSSDSRRGRRRSALPSERTTSGI